LLCTSLTVADFIRHGSAPLFWLSLVLWFLPAALAFVHGVTGLYAICSRCGPYIELGPSEPHPQYNDLDDDDGPLAMAFHSQQDLSHAANEEDTTEPTMTALLDRDANEIRRPRVSHSLMRDNENRPATRANLMFQRYWHGHATLETTCSSTRFRWQEKLKNLKDGRMVFCCRSPLRSDYRWSAASRIVSPSDIQDTLPLNSKGRPFHPKRIRLSVQN